jgi:hypothetical protein
MNNTLSSRGHFLLFVPFIFSLMNVGTCSAEDETKPRVLGQNQRSVHEFQQDLTLLGGADNILSRFSS